MNRQSGNAQTGPGAEEPRDGGRQSLRQLWAQIWQPIPAERSQLNRNRWDLLPASLRSPQQAMGRTHHSCGATHGVMERCDFACTSCYLSSVGNATPPLAGALVQRQLDELRAFLGPQGKAQLTSGEVTLLPVETLGEYVAYARRIGLDPMVMSHGQRWLDEPEYLLRLVRDHGLRKISIHIDSTQRGRRGWHCDQTEAELHPIRSRYAELIRAVRRQTGRTLHAATTVTVNSRNFGQIPKILEWLVANADAFRMVSFQPVAEVGRTQDRRMADLGLDDVWNKICEGLGQPLNRHAFHFGHPECHIVAPLVIIRSGKRRWILETARSGRRWDRGFLDRWVRAVGGFSTNDKPLWLNTAQAVGLALRNPRLVLEAPLYGLYRAWGARAAIFGLARGALAFRPASIRPLAVVVHKFMGTDELETPMGRERLAACVFQLPVDGGMVPMCQMNGTPMRRKLNDELRQNPTEGRQRSGLSTPRNPVPARDPGPGREPEAPRSSPREHTGA